MFSFSKFFKSSRIQYPIMEPVKIPPVAPKGWFQLIEPEASQEADSVVVVDMYVKFGSYRRKDAWFDATSFHQYLEPKSFLKLAATAISIEWVKEGPYEPIRDGELAKKLDCLEKAHYAKIENDKHILKNKLLRDAKKVKCK